MATGKVEDGMRGDGAAKGCGIIGYAVAFDAECVYVDPFFARWLRADGRRERRRHCGERLGLVIRADGAGSAFAGNDKAIAEVVDLVDRGFAGDGFAAFTESGKGRCVPQHRIFKTDLSKWALLQADGDNRARDVLEARVLDPEFIGIAGVEIDSGGKIAERIADKGEAGLVLTGG